MPADRVREIQDALKREGFFEGDPTGQYDKATVEAMTGYQKSRNFRATGYPTAEALQSLGLTKSRIAAPSAPSARVESETETQTKSQMQVPPPEGERNNR
jgi:peptidoglycan hydrolase-like protein with peptidoglycan-binding domain